MDPFEATKRVHERILKLEQEPIARKIVGYVYLQENPDQEMIRLALGPDNLIQNLVEKAKTALRLVPIPVISPPISPSVRYARIPSLSPRQQRVLPPRLARLWNNQLAIEQQQMDNANFIGSPPEDYRFGDQFMGPEDQIEMLNSGASGVMNNCYMQSALEGPVKTCHYFIKGFCKHGNNCRYSHGQSFMENYPHMFDPNLSELGNEDQVFLPGQLEMLEMEITELLKSRGGSPISIASLPLLYYEMYGRTLRAEGYLAESKRHGKVGFSLTKLLACLRNSIRLIDRPHGQHAVILAEDAPNYMGFQGERHEPGTNFSSLHQIYLTFPAESAFSEEDVSNYFSTFGPVQDVRIPCQQRRMFGFVTFVSSDTVKIILAKGNPHFVCGARVLVKPYREKSKLFERKYHEKLDQLTFNPSHHMVTNTELQARSIREQLIEEHRKALEHEMRRFSKLELTRKSLSNNAYTGYSMSEPKVSEEQFNYLLNVLNSVPATDNTDQESNQGVDLPDSPFASVVASSIAAII